jgi:signal transduction histidine kinase
MYFVAGILFAWATVHVVIAIFMVFVYLRYSRNRDYLAFSVWCGFLLTFFLAQVVHYTSNNVQGIDFPTRLEGVVLPIGAAILLYIAEKRAGITTRTKFLFYILFGSIAIGLAILSILGLTFDPSRVITKRFDFFTHDATLYEYEYTIWGYLQIVVSLIYATLAGLLLAKSVKADKVARNFFLVGVVVLNVLTIHDILLLADSIKSFYLVAHGLFIMSLCVLFGFVREVEISRGQLTARTQALKQASINLNRVTNETRRLRPMADLGRLSASLAHEIRNPLAVLSNVASSLRHHNAHERDHSKVEPLISMMQEETDRLARLVDDLLLFSQTSRMSNGTVDIPSLVTVALNDVARLYEPSMSPEIVTEVDDHLPSISGNQDNLRRALTNLIANSFQSSRGCGTVRVIACQKEEHPDAVMVGVVDDAGGVPVEHQSDIFDPFFSTRPTGTGLGLPIAKSIAEAHLGSLVFENRPGEGAGFWLCLPISKRENEIEDVELPAKAQAG